jgi:UDP:flavonoid glycosyltransferase YjiC (YdhE family)
LRILFSFTGGRGHLEPLVPLARAAEAAAHAVAMTGRRALVPTVRELGFAAFESGPTTTPERRPLQPVDRVREERDLRGFVDSVGRLRLRDVRTLLREWPPDIVVCDEFDFGAMLAAELDRLPHAAVLVAAAGSFARDALLDEPLNALRAEYDLPPTRTSALLARHLILSPVPPSFRDPRFPLPEAARAFRAIEPTPRVACDRPLVYVTLGTIFNIESGDLFPRVLDGVARLDVDVLATVGPQIDPAEVGELPANVRIERFVPQAEALRDAAAVVCHAGSGTVLGALTFGLPIVAIPMGADQPWNGDRIAALGLGVVLDPISASPDDVRCAVEQVLGVPSFAATATWFARECAALPPPEQALGELERLVR